MNAYFASRGLQQAKRNNLDCLASKWAQFQGWEHSKGWNMMCYIKRKSKSPLFLENGNTRRESNRNLLILYAFPRFKFLQKESTFQPDGALLLSLQTELQPI